MNERIKGTGVALVTPFTRDLEPDLEALSKLVEHVVSGGVDYLVVLGTTGESATLGRAEKQEIFRAVARANRGRLPLVAGIGGNHTAAVVADLAETNLEGYEAILSVSPYYNRPTQEGIFRHFKTLSENSPLPLILYNVPSRTASNVLPETVLRLAASCGNLLGIKEASGDMAQIEALIREAPEGFMVISGDDLTAVPTVLAGGAGVISVLAQGIPGPFSRMIRLAMQGGAREALEAHHRIEPLVEMLFREGNPAGIKALLSVQQICQPWVRLPLVPAGKALQDDLEAFLHRILSGKG
ncbi:4-hydroxy-tetrahydrodipicolinate synthase [Robiginitalea marina]|uniref:4-hydroxy-tetrahydrodipicolinate synthase n=1 Tax=Robiginitalea marina TaxID=2954105 RepID=A0ABT1AUT0_9FLAO|nr:4-hydroxy-tetrahydrodipicolinate synthase [Robiginitalea marina]MCO5723737.1 4-hydroxy-tetrahydrodipicolinate synthase [Robiginitalea marina]